MTAAMATFLSDRTLKGYIHRSLGIHLLVILVLAIFSFFYNSSPRKRPYNLNLIKSSVRVDVVGMPKLTFQELKALEKIAAKDRSQGKDTRPSESVSPKREEQSFQDMLKQISQKKLASDKQAKQNVKSKNKSRRKLSREARRKLQNLVLAGNKVSQGSAFTGDVSDEAIQGLAAYMALLPEKVRPHWRLPSYLKEAELRCRVRIFLDDRGKLLKSEILESSGEDEYDLRALEAVQATTFPPPEPLYQKQAREGSIVLGFPL